MRNDMQNSLIETLIRVAGIEAEPMLQLQELEIKKEEVSCSLISVWVAF